ncbi:MAG: hypothetical protein BWY06_01805 [Candidatus Latescibacteria bacterium ADurb.Bin168]|nr:MAG: hypothetical protein BWY06_01805 [Candidatus Latescibacteria bacterium ADurb.Bin168]
MRLQGLPRELDITIHRVPAAASRFVIRIQRHIRLRYPALCKATEHLTDVIAEPDDERVAAHRNTEARHTAQQQEHIVPTEWLNERIEPGEINGNSPRILGADGGVRHSRDEYRVPVGKQVLHGIAVIHCPVAQPQVAIPCHFKRQHIQRDDGAGGRAACPEKRCHRVPARRRVGQINVEPHLARLQRRNRHRAVSKSRQRIPSDRVQVRGNRLRFHRRHPNPRIAGLCPNLHAHRVQRHVPQLDRHRLMFPGHRAPGYPQRDRYLRGKLAIDFTVFPRRPFERNHPRRGAARRQRTRNPGQCLSAFGSLVQRNRPGIRFFSKFTRRPGNCILNPRQFHRFALDLTHLPLQHPADSTFRPRHRSLTQCRTQLAQGSLHERPIVLIRSQCQLARTTRKPLP